MSSVRYSACIFAIKFERKTCFDGRPETWDLLSSRRCESPGVEIAKPLRFELALASVPGSGGPSRIWGGAK